MPPKKKSKIIKKSSKKTISKPLKENQKPKDKNQFYKLMEKSFVSNNEPDVKLVKKGQYKLAFELLEDAEACQLTPILIGPPGTGKTLLARSFASSRNKNFEWMTLDESTNFLQKRCLVCQSLIGRFYFNRNLM